MILVAAAIEDDFLDSGSAGAFGDNFADHFRRGDVASALDFALDVRVERTGRRERMPFEVINHLHTNVLERAVHAKTRAVFRTRERLGHAVVNALAGQIARKFSCRHNSHCSSPSVFRNKSDPDARHWLTARPASGVKTPEKLRRLAARLKPCPDEAADIRRQRALTETTRLRRPSTNFHRFLRRGLCRAGLARFLLQTLTDDANALLLVRIGRTQRAHVGRNLADQAFISTSDRDVRLLLDGHLYPFRNRERHRMRIAEREDDGLAFDFGAVADADNV